MNQKPILQSLLTFILMLTLSQSDRSQNDGIELSYEKTTDITAVLIRTLPVMSESINGVNIKGIMASNYYQGSGSKVPDSVNIGIDVKPCQLPQGFTPYLTLWADELSYYIGPMASLYCSGGPLRESQFLRVEMPHHLFQQIFKAEKVEVQFGEIKFELTQKQLNVFRSFSTKMNP
jgi:hypothetical protein